MASDLLLAPELYRCYYCQFESADHSFKYFDNKKVDQPRHQCHQCHKLFTLGVHGRPQGRTYAKKRNEDPVELKCLSRQCRHCGVADNAAFKYYNNNNRLQPRFKCLSCGKQFQMRLMGTGDGDEMRLVHTSGNQRHATRHCKKPREPEAFTNASNFGEESYQPLEVDSRLIPESCEEDVQYASLLEAELTDENESANDSPISCKYANVDNYGLVPEMSAEESKLPALFEFESLTDENEPAPNADPAICNFNVDDGLLPALGAAKNAEFLAFLEADLLTDGNEGPKIDTFSSTTNVDDILLPWSDNDANLLDFKLTENRMRTDESNDAEMLSENMTNIVDSDCTSNAELVFETQLEETLAPGELDSWINDTIEDPSSPNYLDAAVACCKSMDTVHSIETGVRSNESNDIEMVSENMTNMDSNCTSNLEVVSGTQSVETLATAELDSWSNDKIEDPSSLNYLEAAAACCKLMDMAHSKPVAPVQPVESSSSNAGSTISFGDSSCTTSERYSFQQDLMEEDECSVSDWNEWQEQEDDMEMAPCF